jgi:hypothetical protein
MREERWTPSAEGLASAGPKTTTKPQGGTIGGIQTTNRKTKDYGY